MVVPLLVIPYGYMGKVESLEAAQQERWKEGKELTERTAQRLCVEGFQAHALVEEGDPKTAILERVADWSADVIFMGSHGRKGVDRFLIGSASEAVLRHAPCSVEIVRMPAPRTA